MSATSDDLIDLGYRAEDMNRQELERCTILTAREESLLRKLKSPGQRLLIGPRGSGKSTYLRLARYQLQDEAVALPIYVNYAKSLSLEPELRRDPSALAFFRQWVLALILRGLSQATDALGLELAEAPAVRLKLATTVADAVERRRVDQAPPSDFTLTEILEILERVSATAGRRRVVLLLDDAAHAFSPEQQREFFEIFGNLRSRVVSAKAAVYPGVTTYTPRFQVGHDVQVSDVWLDPSDPDFIPMMSEMCEKRLDAESLARLRGRRGALEYLALASFGLPRNLLSMLSQFLEEDEDGSLKNTTQLCDSAIEDSAAATIKVFLSLEEKLPRYKNFVAVGSDLVGACIDAISTYNSGRPGTTKVVSVLLQEPVPAEVDRILGLLEYAGVLRRSSNLSMGPKSFRQVVIHYSLLLTHGAMALGRNPSIAEAIDGLARRESSAARVRRTLASLLGKDFLSRCKLDMAACQRCGTPREIPEARFCSHCGAPLTDASIYEELLSTSIEKLPISQKQLDRITAAGKVSTVQDILTDEENVKLLAAEYIGPKRAAQIKSVAEEFIYE
ncbi:AAA family ATPase [Allobranchiibius sp. CTAmp26]|uniref:AAA family ATPase n=1 Tax=Allobranchiibius sp. CTAmp26 TaxID=2815214 RepID=UPI001AA0F4FC|nr:AAA family ATPase [Allobranchiibius sp. CTAmp26]MBO1756681.1 AAA family ATPase [Allobranchiibius sp. CTAmp26]